MQVPAGTPLVFGAAAQEIAHERPVKHVFPSDWGNGKPIEIEVSGMPVFVMIKRLPDDFLPAQAAVERGFFLQLKD